MSTMWSTCSMSTGHWFTQAPQVVHDHSTSGSITPYIDSSPISGRSSCATVPSDAVLASPAWAAIIAGAASIAWSRSAMIRSLGDSGFSVFQAGHCDWQRPHSVQAVSYTHLRAHETPEHLVCRLLLEK